MRYITKMKLAVTTVTFVGDVGNMAVLGTPELHYPQHHEVQPMTRLGAAYYVGDWTSMTINPAQVTWYGVSNRPVWVEVPDDIDEHEAWLPARLEDVRKVVAHFDHATMQPGVDKCPVTVFEATGGALEGIDFDKVWAVDHE